MPSAPNRLKQLIILALLASFALSACGVRGTLKTPPPIWGEGVTAPSDTTNAPTNTQTPTP